MIIRKKESVSLKRRMLAFLLGLGLVFGIGAVMVYAMGKNPLITYHALFFGAFKSIGSFIATLTETSTLLLVALGLGIAFKCGFWNIGANGQFLGGILLATWFGTSAGGISPIASILLMILAGFIGGGLIGLAPAILKIKRGTNEVFTSLMLNFIMMYVALYLIGSPWKRPGSPYPETVHIASTAQFPILISNTSLHFGVLLSFLSVVVIYLLIYKTTLGYKIRAVGSNPVASLNVGIKTSKILVIAVFLSGGLAGIAGVSELAGVLHRFTYDTIFINIGYLGILVAFLGKNHPLWIALASFFYGVLLTGGERVTMIVGLPSTFIFVLQILILLIILVMDLLVRYEIRLR